MKIIKTVVLQGLVCFGLLAFIKVLFTPSTGYLVPLIDDNGFAHGYYYRVESWWGLSRHDYSTSTGPDGFKYFTSKEGHGKNVPEDAFEKW